MFKPFQTAAVLGAGVMGAQIAAHLANIGLTVHLLDLPAPSGPKNSLVEGAFKKAQKLSPPIFFSEQIAQRVILGNYEEHFDCLQYVDWVIEAVVENLAVKQHLMERLEKTVGKHTIISTNTSGLSISAIAQGRSQSFRQRFLGTHFFNPPRYLKLLEIIPTQETAPEVLRRMEWFGQVHLGKGIVIAKDTPNFIANRIGVFVSLLGIRALTDNGYTIEEIDALTGNIIGRPKSATFRTADLVGLDTLLYVAKNLYPAIAHDESQAIFQVPDLMQKLVETGSLGAKSGQGFYKKVDGEIRSLNPKTFVYESPKTLDLGKLEHIEKLPTFAERLQKLYEYKGRAGDFFRQTLLATLAYSANRIPEIADSPLEIDRAMCWGFGWELGPFEIWDVLGFERVLADLTKANFHIPHWIEVMHQEGATKFYGDRHRVYIPGRQFVTLPTAPDELHIANIQANANAVLWHNSEAQLLDMGDGVVLYNFYSKANTLSSKVIDGLVEVMNLLETRDYRGMVIANEGENFCVGINLAEVGKIVQMENLNPFTRFHPAIAELLNKFQALVQRMYYFHKPIVAAIQGRVLGGGCELAMACPNVVASAETYIGLVELGVGLIPAGGGLMRMARWAAGRAAADTPGDALPFVKKVFETIGMAKVSNSAYEGQTLGFLPPNTKILPNGDRRLYVAKQEVLCLDRIGYRAPIRNPIYVLGQPARSTFDMMSYVMHQGGFISDYDRHLAQRLAYVLTGGDLTAPTYVDDDYLLKLERENFLPLIDESKTQERIIHMLKTKKPLRN